MWTHEEPKTAQEVYHWRVESTPDGDPILYYCVNIDTSRWIPFWGESTEDISDSKYVAQLVLNWQAGIELLGDSDYVVKN